MQKRKQVLGKIVYPSGDYQKDMTEIMAFMQKLMLNFQGKFSIDQRYSPDK